MIDDKSDPGSWAAWLKIKWLACRYKPEDRPLVTDYDTAEGSHVHSEATGEYEAITEWCDEPPKAG